MVNPGRSTERVLNPLSEGTVLNNGDVVRVETGGGGGWGDPWEREVERVLSDVLGGFISVGAARDDYGVAIGADGAVDFAATYQLRGKGDASSEQRGMSAAARAS